MLELSFGPLSDPAYRCLRSPPRVITIRRTFVEFQNETFGSEEVAIDDNIFVNCLFNGTTLRFDGGKISFSGCNFNGITWAIGGDFAYSLNTMRKFGKLGGPKGVKMMADTFANFMRQGNSDEIIKLD